MQVLNYHRDRRYRLSLYVHERSALSQPYQPPAPYQQQAAQGYPNSAPLFQISLLKHTGALIFWQQQTVRYTGTLQQCEQAYKDAQTHCLLAGWWSLASAVVLNWIALFSNMSSIKRIRELAGNPQAVAQQQPQPQPQQFMAQRPPAAIPPGWYPDPAGQPGQRYWDGAAWTHFTHPPAPR